MPESIVTLPEFVAVPVIVVLAIAQPPTCPPVLLLVFVCAVESAGPPVPIVTPPAIIPELSVKLSAVISPAFVILNLGVPS